VRGGRSVGLNSGTPEPKVLLFRGMAASKVGGIIWVGDFRGGAGLCPWPAFFSCRGCFGGLSVALWGPPKRGWDFGRGALSFMGTGVVGGGRPGLLWDLGADRPNRGALDGGQTGGTGAARPGGRGGKQRA